MTYVEGFEQLVLWFFNGLATILQFVVDHPDVVLIFLVLVLVLFVLGVPWNKRKRK